MKKRIQHDSGLGRLSFVLGWWMCSHRWAVWIFLVFEVVYLYIKLLQIRGFWFVSWPVISLDFWTWNSKRSWAQDHVWFLFKEFIDLRFFSLNVLFLKFWLSRLFSDLSHYIIAIIWCLIKLQIFMRKLLCNFFWITIILHFYLKI